MFRRVFNFLLCIDNSLSDNPVAVIMQGMCGNDLAVTFDDCYIVMQSNLEYTVHEGLTIVDGEPCLLFKTVKSEFYPNESRALASQEIHKIVRSLTDYAYMNFSLVEVSKIALLDQLIKDKLLVLDKQIYRS